MINSKLDSWLNLLKKANKELIDNNNLLRECIDILPSNLLIKRTLRNRFAIERLRDICLEEIRPLLKAKCTVELINNADGCKSHYCIGRYFDNSKYIEFFNKGKWTAFGEVFVGEETLIKVCRDNGFLLSNKTMLYLNDNNKSVVVMINGDVK